MGVMNQTGKGAVTFSKNVAAERKKRTASLKVKLYHGMDAALSGPGGMRGLWERY